MKRLFAAIVRLVFSTDVVRDAMQNEFDRIASSGDRGNSAVVADDVLAERIKSSVVSVIRAEMRPGGLLSR